MPKTVLIADDSAFMRRWLKDMLQESRYNVISEAKDGYEAVQKYKQHLPDIVIMDLVMPKLDGIGALKEIKAFHPSAVVIMCTATGQKATIVEAIQNGASEFIIKPNFQHLIPILQKVG
ncbi:response regulator [Bacillus tuaregi]|uniref:response regulator n=1 Tax=Bacillus tuaregi TaxID=1816695 RepID=UPI0008F7F8D1|nr:response regulator [Bacillus tuaregi]